MSSSSFFDLNMLQEMKKPINKLKENLKRNNFVEKGRQKKIEDA